MTEFYLVRHPESEANVQRHYIGGRSNETLVTETGERQARQFARAFFTLFGYPDLLYSSPAIRTRLLADELVQASNCQLAPIIDDRLQELDMGDSTGKLRRDVYTEEIKSVIAIKQQDYRHPNGESINDVADRMEAWLHDVHEQHPDQKIIATTHGQAIRSLVGRVLNWNHHETTLGSAHMTPNVSLTTLSIDPHSKITVHQIGQIIAQSAT